MADDRYGTRDNEVDIERIRLDHLARARDPKTFELLTKVGLTAGWRCLEVGSGNGSVAAFMGDAVGASGSVVSADIDLQFHGSVPSNVQVMQLDVTSDALPVPDGGFDLVHARALLQHLPEREAVFDRLIDALAPGGWLVIEDGDMSGFGAQPVPSPYSKIHELMAMAATTEWRDPNLGVKLVDWFCRSELVDVDVVGDAWAMRPGESGGEWWFLAVERAGPRLIEAGLLTEAELAEALAQIRAPGFVMLSTVSLAVMGRRPA